MQEEKAKLGANEIRVKLRLLLATSEVLDTTDKAVIVAVAKQAESGNVLPLIEARIKAIEARRKVLESLLTTAEMSAYMFAEAPLPEGITLEIGEPTEEKPKTQPMVRLNRSMLEDRIIDGSGTLWSLLSERQRQAIKAGRPVTLRSWFSIVKRYDVEDAERYIDKGQP